MMLQHGRDHDERRYHHDGRTTRRHGRHVDDDEESLPPSEPAPVTKLEPESEGEGAK